MLGRIVFREQSINDGLNRCFATLVFRHIERLEVPEMLKSKFQKGIKLKFLREHFKIFHNNIFIFQPYTGLEKSLKNLHFRY